MSKSTSDSLPKLDSLSPTFAANLGQRIGLALGLLGTRTKASADLGISAEQLRSYIKGKNVPRFDFMTKLAVLTDVSLDWLSTGEPPVHTTKRLDAFVEATGGAEARNSVPVIGLAECGLKGWFNEGPMTVRAAWPGGVVDPDSFGVMAVGQSLLPAGIEPGFLCLCSPAIALDPGDIVFIERRDGHVALKRYLGRDAEWINLEGWLNPDKTGVQAPFNEQLARTHIKRLAPVIYVKRKL